ncbi:protein-tyrosine phosphatase-like, PTPLA [Actinidia rufa]|uniref:Very-long-chain (3R)-3-hydroxyacyl-CoA dehydratase n=1 Tax=Actinidia rufa TaxID=165716 RepID=A0A7J0DUH9_9ERIC|nr:protein-tyrosine phosphatase-like, PTPLA [Actinidia rufa]
MSQLSSLYLFAYNSLQALGWAISLTRILSNFVSIQSFAGAYASAGELICLLQTVAFLEVIHGAIGNLLLSGGGRTHFLLAIVRGLDEVIRYPHYALNCVGSSPSLITYLRYTAFIVLYPLGLAGEMWLMYEALPFIKAKSLYADFFAGLPFTYYNFVRVLLLCYPFMWLKLYLHLIKQRKSKLGKQHKKKKN